MSTLRPTTFLFINSKNRLSGNPWDFTINVNNELIKAPKDHYMRISVEQASINRSWYSIQEGLNTFNIVNHLNVSTTITIPVGYYNASDVRAQLQSLMPQWVITYDKKLNKFNFTRPNDGITSYRFVFTNSSIADLMGFNQSEQPTFTIGNPTLPSSKPIKVNEDSAVYVHSSITRQRFSALDNINPTVTESDVLCCIPIQTAPFDNVIFTRNGMGDFTFNVLVPSIHQIRFYLTNEQGTILQVPYDWTCVLSMQYIPFNDDETKPVLKQIRDYIQYFILHNGNLSA